MGRNVQHITLDMLLEDCPGGNRMDAAKCLYKILDLTTIGSIAVSQDRPYGAISIRIQGVSA